MRRARWLVSVSMVATGALVVPGAGAVPGPPGAPGLDPVELRLVSPRPTVPELPDDPPRALVAGVTALSARLGVAQEPGALDAAARLSPAVSGAATREIPFTLGDVPCSLIPVPAAAAQVGTGTCPGVRPGGRVVSTVGDCTLNFLFRSPDGTRYIGTAGHCVSPGPVSNDEVNLDGKGRVERVWSWGSGPVAEDSAGHRIGEFAYAVIWTPKDFALIRLDPGVEASPEMCHFGAPRGVYATNTDTALVLQYYGNGVGIDGVAPARSAVALGTPNPDYIYALGLAAPGDSGAGVMTADGLAVGVLVTTGFHGIRFKPGPYKTPTPHNLPQADEHGVDVGTMGITRLAPQLVRASAKMGVPLELVTAR